VEERRPKRTKVSHISSAEDWEDFEKQLTAFEHHHVKYRSRFAFAFVDGPIAKAIRNGQWYNIYQISIQLF
jgi:midasin